MFPEKLNSETKTCDKAAWWDRNGIEMTASGSYFPKEFHLKFESRYVYQYTVI